MGLTCEEEEERRQRGTGEGGRVKERGREGEREGGKERGRDRGGRKSEGGRVREGEEGGSKYKLLCTTAYTTKSDSQREEWNESVHTRLYATHHCPLRCVHRQLSCCS